VLPKNSIDGYDALLKCFVQSSLPEGETHHVMWWDELSATSIAIDHLERSGRPVRVDISYGWAPSY
jgi:hypothetical protein